MHRQVINKRSFSLNDNYIFLLECLLILLVSLFPLLRDFPFHGNIYLSWEGAYRLYLGQIPFKDFGLPMGFGYWLIPALFFKIFGPYLFTLIKAQAFINILSAFAFRSILKSFNIPGPVRLLTVLLFLISYTYINYWPWYNHTVIVFELIGLALLLKYIFKDQWKFRLVYLFGASFFLFLSFFTKQDAGGLAFLVGLSLIIGHGIYEKKISPILWFLGFYLLIALCVIIPFIPYNIGYWFNYGQPPHYDRLSIYDLIDVFLSRSMWLKFYVLIIILILITRSKQFFHNKKNLLFTILTIGILFEASITQVTSYVPKNTNIFFHSFAIIYIFTFSGLNEKISLRRPLILGIVGALILLWWSPYPWNYAKAVLLNHFPGILQKEANTTSIRNYILEAEDDTTMEDLKWVSSPWKQFSHIYMPEETINGIKDVLNLNIVKEKGDSIQFLNMSELTPVEDILGYTPETGPNIPLWYQKNIGMFEKHIKAYERKIKNNYYDLILYEYVPSSNNFYPFEIEDALNKYYYQVDSFIAPRSNTYGSIKVYIQKNIE